MAQLPTAEQCGKQVLYAYRAKGVRPGQMLMLQHLRGSFSSGQWQLKDLETGLKWCIEQGYLSEDEQKPGGNTLLTETGFASLPD